MQDLFKTNLFYKYSIKSVPRILSNMNRNPLSSSYGCMHRDYWMYKTSDFSDAIRQFPTYALSMIYKKNLEFFDYDKKNLLSIITASLDFTFSIQHKDGSFDEFYPNERGWVGPTAFTIFSILETIENVKNNISKNRLKDYKKKISLTLDYISKGNFEGDSLANHHAMACLALWKGYRLTKKQKYYKEYKKTLSNFLKNYHVPEEGWSKEYDGLDPGYLSATISFFGKIFKDNEDPIIKKICLDSLETLKYFFYPNYHFGGTIGSRNTQHIYTHGFAVFYYHSETAKNLLNLSHLHLDKKTQISPETMSDRYFGYRIPEYLETYQEIKDKKIKLSNNRFKKKIPYKGKNFIKFFKKAKIKIINNKDYYALINLAKGGLVKYFCKNSNTFFQDSGVSIILSNKKYLTSQNIDKDYSYIFEKDKLIIEGNLIFANNEKNFTPLKSILFRSFLLFLYIFPKLSRNLKSWIRSILMFNSKFSQIVFKKTIDSSIDNMIITYQIESKKNYKFKDLFYNCDIFSRYVPQSQFFQPMQLLDKQLKLNKNILNKFKKNKILKIITNIKKKNVKYFLN